MSLLDLDAALIPIARKIELVYGPLVDAQEFPEDVDVTFIEGAVSTHEDVEKVQQIRQRSKIVVSLGDCAVTGNVAAMRNTVPVKKLLQSVYVEKSDRDGAIPTRESAAACASVPAGAGLRQDRYLRPGLPAAEQGYRRSARKPARRPQARSGHEAEVWLGAGMKRITIEPVTRIEGHGKITIQLDDRRHGCRRAVSGDAGPRLREIRRGPPLLRDAGDHLAHLRHLPHQPSARIVQGLRRHHGRPGTAGAQSCCAN